MLTIAITIGATASLFSVVHGIVLDSLLIPILRTSSSSGRPTPTTIRGARPPRVPTISTGSDHTIVGVAGESLWLGPEFDVLVTLALHDQRHSAAVIVTTGDVARRVTQRHGFEGGSASMT